MGVDTLTVRLSTPCTYIFHFSFKIRRSHNHAFTWSCNKTWELDGFCSSRLLAIYSKIPGQSPHCTVASSTRRMSTSPRGTSDSNEHIPRHRDDSCRLLNTKVKFSSQCLFHFDTVSPGAMVEISMHLRAVRLKTNVRQHRKLSSPYHSHRHPLTLPS